MEDTDSILKVHEGNRWMYFTAKPHCEKNLCRALSAQKVVCYLPMIRKTTEYSHRIHTRTTPLFPGYVFASTCRMGFDIAGIDRYVGRCHFPDEARSSGLLRDLIAVRKFERLAEKHKVQVLVDFEVGEPVEISRGYFKGERAVVKRINSGHDEVLVQLTALPVAMTVQLPVDFLSKNIQL